MTEDNRSRFVNEGYAVLTGWLDSPACRTLADRLELEFERAGANAGHEPRPSGHCRLLAGSSANDFSGVSGAREWATAAGALLTREVRLVRIAGRSIDPFAPEPEPLRSELHTGDDRVLARAFLVLDTPPKGRAVLRLVPRSHLTAERPDAAVERLGIHAKDSFPGEVAVGSAAGTLLLLDVRIWHGTVSNPGDRHLRLLEADFAAAGIGCNCP